MQQAQETGYRIYPIGYRMVDGGRRTRWLEGNISEHLYVGH